VPKRLPAHNAILLVEDDPDLRVAIADVLRDAGRAVVEARDGDEAFIKLLELRRPCLILLDLLMPNMDGFEFLERLKQRPDASDFPVLVLSAHGSVGTTEHFPGVVGTLQKPFNVRTLLSWVETLC
jgi:two-component system chemotaxis response regulator CheY